MTTQTLPGPKFSLADAWHFAVAHKRIALTIAVTALALGALLFSPYNPVPSVAFAPITFVVALASLGGYERALNRRIADEQGPQWTVFVNGIKVGTISDSQYARLRSFVYLNVQTYTAQLANFARAAIRIFTQMLTVIPALLFWLLVIGLVLDPSTVKGIFQAITSSEFLGHYATLKTLSPLLTFALLWAPIGSFFGARFGFRNIFEDDVREKVRLSLKCGTRGGMTILCLTDGNVCCPDALARLHPADSRKNP